MLLGVAYIALTNADADLAMLRAHIEPLLATHQTVLIDDIHVLDTAPESACCLAELLCVRHPRLVLAGRQLPSRLDPTRRLGSSGRRTGIHV